MRHVVAAAVATIGLASTLSAQSPVTTLPVSQNTCQLSDVKTLSMVNSVACAGRFNNVNDANSISAILKYLNGTFGEAYGPWTHLGQSDAANNGPFTGNPEVKNGQLNFDGSQSGYFAVVLKGSTRISIYILDGGAEGTNGVTFSTAALGNHALSHAGLYDGGMSTTVTPEPSTYILLAAGLAGMGVVSRRRRKA